ncbi:MAG TPA: hypothetical protein VIJ25_08805 [Methylococcales bacterium]
MLEQEVIPEFYSRDAQGIPSAWVARMRESMARLKPVVYSVGRAVRQYTGQYYLPAANAYNRRAANNGAEGRQLAEWQHRLKQQWAHLRFGEMKIETGNGQHRIEIQIYVDDLDTAAIRVELYAEAINER